MTSRALIVEDNADLAKLIQIHLQDIDFKSDICKDGETALASFGEGKYQLILLDVMLPGIDGLDVCRQIRQYDARIPIMMLTARSEEIDRVVGLELGADDYIAKPFGVAEFSARVKALMRRALLNARDRRVDAEEAGGAGRADLICGEIRLSPTSHSAWLSDRPIDLTLREFELLHFLMRHPDQVFSREQLLKKVWKYSNGVYQHTVNSHINRLRGKIENNPHRPSRILTVWGVGYKFAAQIAPD